MKNYKFLILVGLVAIFVCSIYMKYSSNLEAQRAYQENLQAARESRELDVWVDAEAYYKQALEHRESVDTRLELGQMYVDFDLGRKAAEWGEDLNAKYPGEIKTYEFLMDLYTRYNDLTACFRVYDKAEKLGISSEKTEEIMDSVRYSYYTTGKYDNVGIYSGNYCAVQSGERWGYTDFLGDEVISPRFACAGPFASEVAPVVDEEGNAYFIDGNGNKKIVIPNVEHIESLGLIENNLFSLYDGDTWGFYNPKGEMLFGGYKDVSSIGNGVAAVMTEENVWALLDSAGTELSKERYDGVIEDEKGIVCRNDRIFAEKLGYVYLIDSKGNKITGQKFEDADVFNSSGLAAVEIEGQWGFVDLDGNVMIEPQFEDAKSFSKGLAAVKTGNQWGYVDETGRLVIPAQFEDAMDFNSGGSAYVKELGIWKLIVLYQYNH